MLEVGADLFQIQGIDIVQIDHRVGIAHRHAGYLISLALHRKRTVFDFAIGIDGDLAPFENRFAHVDFDQIADDLWPDDTRQCFHFDRALLRDAMVVDIFGETADAVAAHLHLAAVGVVDLHFEVGDLRGMHRQQLIRANAETAVAKPLGHGFEILDVVLQTIEKDEIVARPMHLGKLQFHNFELLNR